MLRCTVYDYDLGGDRPTGEGPGDASTGLVGWAATANCGPSGTTGGLGGPTHTATSTAELIELAAAAGPSIIEISGVIDLNGEVLEIGSDKTLLGTGGAEIAGFTRIGDASNVIVRNIRFNGASSESTDAVEVTASTCVWLDHCEFFDGADGNLDIVRGSDWITVSWSKVYYVQRTDAHRLASLCGNSDEDTPGKINITFHHNWWGPNLLSQMPRVRHGKVHIFNNYYSSSGNDYCIGAGYLSTLLVENNLFDGVNTPIRFMDDQGTAQVLETGNVSSNTSGEFVSTGSAFEPPYIYTLEAADIAKDRVLASAGAR